jgi:hypothetical protein
MIFLLLKLKGMKIGEKNIEIDEKFFGVVILCLSLLILFPKNIDTLFYYDDNPIRYMVAKKLADGNIKTTDEFVSFLSFGSAEIYIPFFLVSKIFNIQNDEIIYNFASLFYFVLSCLLLIFYLANSPGFTYILVIFCILGISAVVGGHIHWLLSSVLFTVIASKISSSQKLSISDYVILGIIHFISPPLIVFSAIFSFIEKRLDIFFASFVIFFLKASFGSDIIAKYTRILLSEKTNPQNFVIEDKLFLPISFDLFLRVLCFNYFNLSFIFAPLIYFVVFRSIFTKRRSFIFVAFLYYTFVIFSAIVLRLWEKGLKLSGPLFALSSFIFSPNPIRFVPLFLTISLFYIEKTRFDYYFKFIALSFFLVRAATSLFGFGPLPEKFPESINLTIEYVLNNTKEGEKILVEGDEHIFEKGKLIHPLYNSHIFPYIIAKVSNRNFIGLGVPWGAFSSPFVAGRFKEKQIDKSEILSFISENDIRYVLCWTQECENFFRNLGKKIFIIDKFKIVHLYGD